MITKVVTTIEASQHEDVSTKLVMQRFFRALKDENLLGAELWAGHKNFAHGEDDYGLVFDKLVQSGKLGMDTIEWLLTYTKGTHNTFFKRAREHRKRRYNMQTWRGTMVDRIRAWQQNLVNVEPAQKRCIRLGYELGWLSASQDLVHSAEGRAWLLEVLSGHKVLKMALHRNYDYDKKTYSPICRELVDALIKRGEVDLDSVGDELVSQYKSKDGRAIALQLIAHRDRSKPMPAAFTDFIKEVLLQHEHYLNLQQDLPTLLEGKTHEFE